MRRIGAMIVLVFLCVSSITSAARGEVRWLVVRIPSPSISPGKLTPDLNIPMGSAFQFVGQVPYMQTLWPSVFVTDLPASIANYAVALPWATSDAAPNPLLPFPEPLFFARSVGGGFVNFWIIAPYPCCYLWSTTSVWLDMTIPDTFSGGFDPAVGAAASDQYGVVFPSAVVLLR